MPDHLAFGGILRSDLPIPTLRPSPGGTPSWTFRRAAEGPPSPGQSELLGEEQLDATCRLQVYKTHHGLRFVYTDTGVFDIAADGTDVTWYPVPEAQEDLALIDLTGRVMAGALHLSGHLCLHGSAVAFTDGGIAFLAPKHHGKSTIATALTRAGALLLTDDTLPVELDPPVRMWPGVHSVRLWNDSAERLAAGRLGTQEVRSGKHILDHLPDASLADHRTLLSAVYILSPSLPGSDGLPSTLVHRERQTDVQAAIAIVQHTKIGGLLGKSEAPVLFQRAVSLAREVPVYRFDFVRDFAVLDDVVTQLLAWHHA